MSTDNMQSLQNGAGFANSANFDRALDRPISVQADPGGDCDCGGEVRTVIYGMKGLLGCIRHRRRIP